ncbi:hypothetical protein PSACC_01927 [Paramicrosporidium saccamoebae]|uniref:Alpha-glucosidase n=1 Tax=Paramicrosporidium saccamoebae TaxID=1246581 RepID=A0A2H9TKI7_9FUNG|nr:hypothetical protein PSACC_01927 [Paramicrosporidium saccamoebae]
MDNKDIFTIDNATYPPEATRNFIYDQEWAGRFVVAIVDPGVTIKEELPAYRSGVEADIFLRSGHSHQDQKEYYEGMVWPGPVHFVDFLCPRTDDYWFNLIADFKKLLPFAGLWLDMSEPACFSNGHRDMFPTPPSHDHYTLNYPSFAINNADNQVELFSKTISMDARHVDGTRHLAVHNIYGFSESQRTAKALEKLEPGRRHFLLTRSTFPGSGRFTAHWLGDNYSDFANMKMSISGVFDFQLFGIPMVGADLCGFLDASNEELCARWMALGAFMPFARNHNAERPENIPQEPYRWTEVAKVTRKYYALRYSLLPYWYTLHYKSHKTGQPMIRPLFFEFPTFAELYDNDEQFMVGGALLVAPVLKRGTTSVQFKLPPGVWYDLVETENAPVLVKEGLYPVHMAADLQTIPVLFRGGHVILKQDPALTIRDTQLGDYHLMVALTLEGKAWGHVYFDNGISSDPGNNYSLIEFAVNCDQQSCVLDVYGTFGYRVAKNVVSVTLLSTFNLHREVSCAALNAQEISVDAQTSQYKLHVKNLSMDLNQAQQLRIVFTPT